MKTQVTVTCYDVVIRGRKLNFNNLAIIWIRNPLGYRKKIKTKLLLRITLYITIRADVMHACNQ